MGMNHSKESSRRPISNYFRPEIIALKARQEKEAATRELIEATERRLRAQLREEEKARRSNPRVTTDRRARPKNNTRQREPAVEAASAARHAFQTVVSSAASGKEALDARKSSTSTDSLAAARHVSLSAEERRKTKSSPPVAKVRSQPNDSDCKVPKTAIRRKSRNPQEGIVHPRRRQRTEKHPAPSEFPERFARFRDVST